jgi:hypothetical protein
MMMSRRSLLGFAFYSFYVTVASSNMELLSGSEERPDEVQEGEDVGTAVVAVKQNALGTTEKNFQFVRTAAAANTNTNTTHCTDHIDCQSCNAASWCHWCGSTKGCHVQGSASGCGWGESCASTPPSSLPPAPAPAPAPSPANNDTCLAHSSCADCAVYSRWCHWCAHDNACHLIGSFYGCVRGVDCYDITHCKRVVPEPMNNNEDGDEEGPFALPELRLIPSIVAAVLAAVTLCCATLCCCAVRFTKDAYNDLVRDVTATTPLLLNNNDDDDDDMADQHDTSTSIDGPVVRSAEVLEEEVAPADHEVTDGPGAEQDDPEEDPPDPPDAEEEPAVAPSSPHRTARRAAATTSRTRTNTRPLPPRRPPHRTIHRLYNACVGCYCVTLLAVAATSYAIIKYFPQPPEYSICNDAVAWQSIVDAMAHMSVAADFELLASIQNPNYLDVQVIAGSGSLYHKNDFVGSFVIPAITIQRRSITDLLVTATFAPDKWKALSIGAEYYAGTLMLTLDSQVTIRIPMLMGYTFTVTVKDLLVDVNQAADRHLCACPTWSDARIPRRQPPLPLWLTTTTMQEDTTALLLLSSLEEEAVSGSLPQWISPPEANDSHHLQTQ